jgi:peptidoglycan L-alanyl-D-glutamate endopeptidase CwlK
MDDMVAPDERYDLLGRIDTLHLYQPFLERLNGLLNACAARGAIYVATGALRTYEQQDALYAQGRTKPGGIVTQAKGGQSLHNFAIAVDFCRHAGPSYQGHLIPDYRDEQYEILAQEAERLGLESGLRWKFKDSPHIQLPYNKLHGIRLRDLDAQYRKGGYEAVFAFLDKFQW